MSVPPQGPYQQGHPQQPTGGQRPQWGAPQGGYPPPGASPQGFPPQGHPQGFPQGGAPPPGQPGARPPKKSGALGTVLGCVGVLLVGVVLTVVASVVGMDSGAPEPGECVDVTNDEYRELEYETTACGTQQSDHEVVEVAEDYDPCSGDYSEISKGSTTLCLVPDVRVGDCQKVPFALGIDTKVPCSDPAANVEVAGVVENEGGDAACPDEAEKFTTYHRPPKTLCFKATP